MGTTTREAAAVAAATVAAAGVWALWTVVGGVDLTVRSGDEVREVGLGAVVVTTLLAGAAAVAALRVLLARTARGRTWWTVVAAGVWVASLLGPLSARGATSWTGLTSLHLVVGAVLLVGLLRAHPTPAAA